MSINLNTIMPGFSHAGQCQLAAEYWKSGTYGPGWQTMIDLMLAGF